MSIGSRCIMPATNTKESTFGYFADLDTARESMRYSDVGFSMGFLVRFIKNRNVIGVKSIPYWFPGIRARCGPSALRRSRLFRL
jgi:hypothetical protein